MFAPAGLFLEVLFGYMSALAPSYEVFATSRLLVGLMNGGIGVVCFVLAQEYVGKSYWAMTGMNPEAEPDPGPFAWCWTSEVGRGLIFFAGTLTSLGFAVGIALFAALGYLIRPWRNLAMAANSFGLFCFLMSV